MASIVQRNKSYAVVYYQAKSDGEKKKQTWETYHSLESALKRKADIENPINFLKYVPQVTYLRDLLAEYIRLHGKVNWSFSMYANYTSLIKRYIEPFIGGVKLIQINALMMSRFYEQLRKTPASENKYRPNQEKLMSNNTIFEIHQLLRSVFNQAVIWGYMKESPVRHLRIKKSKRSISSLTPEQVLSLIDMATLSGETSFSLAIQVAFFASMRKGEIMALKWDDIDFVNCSVHVDKELARVSLDSMKAIGEKDIYYIFEPRSINAKSRLVLKSPKTESSVRMIYIPKTLSNNLLKWRNAQADIKKVQRQKYHDHGLVFAKENGMPLQGKELSST